MKDVCIRRAAADDAEALSVLIKGAMESYRRDSNIPEGLLESLNESIDSIRHRIIRHDCLVMEDGPDMIGTVTFSICGNPLKYSFSEKTRDYLSRYGTCGYISRLAVTDPARSAGLGGRLVGCAIDLAEQKDIPLVLLHTAVSNRKMKDFYFRSGFELIDSENSRGYERGLFGRIIRQ